MQPLVEKRLTRVLPTVVLRPAILETHVDAARRFETAVEGADLARFATNHEKNLLALTHPLFTQPARFMQLDAFSHCRLLGLSPKRQKTGRARSNSHFATQQHTTINKQQEP
jgi:hypothetical protein